MRMKTIASFCALVAVGAFAAGGFADPPAVMILSKPQVFGSLSRPAVRFTHGAHATIAGVSCLTCHHVYKDGKNVLDVSTLTAGNPAIQCASIGKVLSPVVHHLPRYREGAGQGDRSARLRRLPHVEQVSREEYGQSETKTAR